MEGANDFLTESSIEFIFCFPGEGDDIDIARILFDGEILK